MSQQVIIKHNRYGIELILDDNIPFHELLEVIVEKFKSSAKFFKDAKLIILFKGRKLSEQEMIEIVDGIMKNSSIEILGIMDENSEMEELMKAHFEAYQNGFSMIEKNVPVNRNIQNMNIFSQTGMEYETGDMQSIVSDFYIGNLRSGQILECASSITIVGDVNPGAKIVSEGNIVVIGALKGNAHAGVAGDNNCFIFALDMSPIQLQVGEYFAKSPDKEKKVVSKKIFKRKAKKSEEGCSPKIALVKEGYIYIEPMKKGFLDNYY